VRGIILLKLTIDRHEAARGLSATAELLVYSFELRAQMGWTDRRAVIRNGPSAVGLGQHDKDSPYSDVWLRYRSNVSVIVFTRWRGDL